jgi:hypothetical protein
MCFAGEANKARHDTGFNGLGTLGGVTANKLTTCPTNSGAIPGICYSIKVKGCSEASDMMPTAVVKVSRLQGTPLGTVTFTTGGGGEGAFYERQFKNSKGIVLAVLQAGYTVVQMSFNGDNGWLTGPSEDGPLALACRHATVTQWIYKNVHKVGSAAPLCATGNSGGAAVIAYELADFNFGTQGDNGQPFYSMAELTSGPPAGRLDVGCLCQNAPAPSPPCNVLTTTCFGLRGKAGTSLWDQAYGNTACTNHDTTFQEQWLNDSVASPFSTYDYPDTDVHVLFGSKDTSASVPLGMEWATQITTNNSIACIKGAGHTMPDDPGAASRIVSDITTYCKVQPPTPTAKLSATSLTFADTTVGSSSAPQDVTLTNVGKAALNIASIATTGDFSQTNTCGSVVDAGASCTISVTFTPTTTGTLTGAVTITDDARNSPQSVSLSGNGVTAPQVQLSTTFLDFGEQHVGDSSNPQNVSLTNTGGSTLTISSIVTSGDFSETDDCNGSVAAGATCTLSIVFTPTDHGDRSGQVTINDNAPDTPQLINLDGFGSDHRH